MKYLSLFSGIGGFEYGIEEANNLSSEQPQAQSGGRYENKGTVRNRYSSESTSSCGSHTGFVCIGFSEIDKYARSIYRRHFPGHPALGDATAIDTSRLEPFDLLVGGFPCQAFSIAGKRKGFLDTRGTLFFEIARILRDCRPRYFLLENVEGLLSHDDRKTFVAIIGVLSDIGYRVSWQVLNTKDYGLPQNRERIFIAGRFGEGRGPEVFPIAETNGIHSEQSGEDSVANCLDSSYHKGWRDKGQRTMIQYGNSQDMKISQEVSQSLNAGHYNQPKILAPTIRAEHHNTADVHFILRDGRDNRSMLRSGRTTEVGIKGQSIRRLTPTEAERLQGFPDGWTEYGADGEKISDTQRYKCLGNAVSTNVITKIIGKWFYEPLSHKGA